MHVTFTSLYTCIHSSESYMHLVIKKSLFTWTWLLLLIAMTTNCYYFQNWELLFQCLHCHRFMRKCTLENCWFLLNMQPVERSVTKQGSYSKLQHAHKNDCMSWRNDTPIRFSLPVGINSRNILVYSKLCYPEHYLLWSQSLQLGKRMNDMQYSLGTSLI